MNLARHPSYILAAYIASGTSPALATRTRRADERTCREHDAEWLSYPGRPVWVLSDARRRLGGLVPGMTSFFKCSWTSCFSSAPLIKVIRFRLANCSLARPNQEVVTSTPVVALWSAMTPVRACTDSRPTRPVQRLACMRQTPPKNRFLLVATASTPPSFDGMVVHASAPMATKSS